MKPRNPAANPSFQGIEPVIAKKMSSLGGINRCLRVIRRHGVISVGVPTPILVCFTSWRLRHLQNFRTTLSATPPPPRIPARSATRLREADLDIFSKLGKQGLEWRLEPEAFTGREVRREDDLLDFPVGCPVDIEVARQPSA